MFKEATTTDHLLKTVSVPSSTWYAAQKKKGEDKRAHNKGRPRSQFSFDKEGGKVSNHQIIEYVRLLRNVIWFQNGGGYKKMPAYLKREFGVYVNKKKLYWLMKESDLLLPRRNGKHRSLAAKASRNHQIIRPFQMWELDIKYGFLTDERRFFYLMAIIDVYLRYIVGFHIGLRCLGKDLSRTLNLATQRMEIPEGGELIIRSDNGPQMRSKNFIHFVDENSDKLVQEFIPCGMPNKNAHIESFNSIIELEFFSVMDFRFYPQAYTATHEFMDFYQTRRVHGSLKNRTPQECLEIFRNGGELNIKPISL
jgi:putative transposase